MQRITNLEHEILTVTHNTIVDFLFTFEEIDDVICDLSIDLDSIEGIIAQFSKGGDGSVNLQQIEEILKIINYNIKCEIPIRPTGFDIRSYDTLEVAWNKYHNSA